MVRVLIAYALLFIAQAVNAGTVTGVVKVADTLTSPSRVSMDVDGASPRYPTIQAAHDALPSTGGMLIIDSNTTITLTSTVLISKPNVTLKGGGIDHTVLLRGNSFTASLLKITADGFRICDLTIDGGLADQTIDRLPRGIWQSSSVYDNSQSPVEIDSEGASAWFDHIKILRMRGEFRLFGNDSKVAHCILIGYDFPNHIDESWKKLPWVPGIFCCSKLAPQGRTGRIIEDNRITGYNTNGDLCVLTMTNNYDMVLCP
jgi:hypothetical protein